MNLSGPPGAPKIAWRWFRASPWPIILLVAAAILLEWVLMFLGPLSWLMLIPTGIWLWKRRWLAAAFCAVLSPVVVSFLLGTSDYARGRAVYLVKGRMVMGNVGYDQSRGCRYQSTGCLVMGSEWAGEDAYNLAVQILTQLLGLQRHAYAGPCPTEDEAFATNVTGTAINEQQFAADQVNLGSMQIALAPGYGSSLLSAIRAERSNWAAFAVGGANPFGPIRAALYKDKCLLISAQFVPTEDQPTNSARVIVLFDRQTGRPFACYVNQSCRRPLYNWTEANLK